MRHAATTPARQSVDPARYHVLLQGQEDVLQLFV